MYRASHDVHTKKTKQTVVKFLGMQFSINRKETEVIPHLNKIPATNEEIKSFIEKDDADPKTENKKRIEALINISPVTSSAVYELIDNKNAERGYPRRKWSAERLVGYEWWDDSKRLFVKTKKNLTDGYIVILKGEHRYPSFPPGGPPRGPPVIVKMEPPVKKTKAKKSAAKIELTTEETQTVINDFLSTFSKLYDGVPVEQRGAALKAVELPDDEDVFDYDSDDSSSSSSSGSLVDD